MEKFAKLLAVMGVRNNTELEDLHSGISPSSKTGDYSDVKVVTPYGEIEWNRLSRINDKEMRSLMLSIEKAIEATLCSYESLNHEEKEASLEFITKQRTYDRKDWSIADKQNE
ncbi:MAG: hypothetical protein LBL36_00145 [Clostridiales Family XIII bacterium]|jgi:hypothetical protein|nr:hypothetical protein [Clostridiales Family XIII bacterium]